jgi:D-alanyl-lipoteichoic acid acyltransferase DltB (MBOAT superfamily)
LRGWLTPLAVLLYTFFVKGCVFGWPGWYYVLQHVFAETLIALEIVDRRLRQCPEEKPGTEPVNYFEIIIFAIAGYEICKVAGLPRFRNGIVVELTL